MKSKKVRVKRGGVFPSYPFTKKVDTCTDEYKSKLYDNRNITDPRELHDVYQKCCLSNQSSIRCQMLKGRFKSVLKQRNDANEYYGYDQSLDENPSMSAMKNYNKTMQIQQQSIPNKILPINESGGFRKKSQSTKRHGIKRRSIKSKRKNIRTTKSKRKI